jgi:hypothetical protein
MTNLFFAAALYLSAGYVAVPQEPVDAPRVLYVISEAVSMRAGPDAKSRAITRLKPFDVVSGRQLVEGWLHVDAATITTPGDFGWIPLAADNIVTVPLESLKARVFRVQQTKWPDRIKLDVVRGRIREGFTGDQVQLALGDPIRKELRETGNDVAEAWTYEGRRIVFSHSGVTTIEELSIR